MTPQNTIHGTTPATLLYNRSSRVTVGTVVISNIGQETGLDVWFQVRRSLKAKEPNTCDLKLWNLSDNSRKALEQSSHPIPGVSLPPGAAAGYVPVKIEAGYVGNMATIFNGNMRSAQTVRDKEDLVTELQLGDGDVALLARVNQAFGPTNAHDVAKTLLSTMGVGNGNLASVESVFRAQLQMFSRGVNLKGTGLDILHNLCQSVGLEVSIQGNTAQFLPLGKPLPGPSYELTSSTGLIGEPSVDTKGVLGCMTLLLPGLKPGSLIFINSAFVQGTYRITSMMTTGDTSGNSWQHQIEAKWQGKAP